MMKGKRQCGMRRAGGAMAVLMMVAMPWIAPASDQDAIDLYKRVQASITGVEVAEPTTDATATPTTDHAARDAMYQRVVDEIQRDTERLWGGSVGHQITPKILDKDQVTELLDRLLGEEIKRPEVQGSAEAMRLLELLPEDRTLEEIYQTLLEGQMGGLYNPGDKSLYVVDSFDPNGFLGKVILSHEIGHAIQDAHYDLENFLVKQTNLDRQKARQALIEGDATVLMTEWGAENATMGSLLSMGAGMQDQMTAGLDTAPPVIVQDMLFSYMTGAEFCTALINAWGPDWRRRAFDDPPSSTSQILHPHKYLADPRVEPLDVHIPLLAENSGYELLMENTLGEWATRLILALPTSFPRISVLNFNPMLKETIAVTASEGWAGDRVAVYRHGESNERLLTWRSVWDSEQDATEFHAALIRRMERYTAMQGATVIDGVIVSPQRRAWVRRRGTQVDFVLATAEAGFLLGREALEQ